MITIESQLQLNLDKNQKLATENGLKISNYKTVCMHLCRLRKAYNNPVLVLDGTPIPVDEEHKFLGVVFNRNSRLFLTAKSKYQKALNLLRVVAQTD